MAQVCVGNKYRVNFCGSAIKPVYPFQLGQNAQFLQALFAFWGEKRRRVEELLHAE
jgi:hypothetical protein